MSVIVASALNQNTTCLVAAFSLFCGLLSVEELVHLPLLNRLSPFKITEKLKKDSY